MEHRQFEGSDDSDEENSGEYSDEDLERLESISNEYFGKPLKDLSIRELTGLVERAAKRLVEDCIKQGESDEKVERIREDITGEGTSSTRTRRLLVDCPRCFDGDYTTRMQQKIRERLKDSETSAFLVSGWKGVGKSRIMKQLMDQIHQEPALFDIIARVRAPGAEVLGEEVQMRIRKKLNKLDSHERKLATTGFLAMAQEDARASRMLELQISITQALGIDVQSDFMPSSIQMKVSRALENKRFLLVIEDVWESIDFKKIGVPAPSNGSKMVITSRSGQGPSYMVRLEEGNEDAELNKEEVWTLFHDESIDVAANLPKYSGLFTGDTVLQCFHYAMLFPPEVGVDGDSLIEYWKLEGFMDDLPRHFQLKEKELTNRELGNALLKELARKCMLLVTPESVESLSITELMGIYSLEGYSRYHVKVESHIRDLIDSRRFLVGFDLSSEEPSNAPNLAHIERISFVKDDDIERLFQKTGSHPPNCPKLYTLFFHGSSPPLKVIPYSFFQCMPLLRVLHLSYCQITSLSSSIYRLHNLRSLELKFCGELEALPSFTQAWKNLVVLDLSGTPLIMIEEASFQNMQYLQRLHIPEASKMTRLSFRGCWSLQSLEIGSQPKLEVLDLSDTMIKQFPSKMPTMEQLRCLYLSDIKIRGGPVHTSRFIYGHVYAQIKHVSMISSQNHLEISGGNSFPYRNGGALPAKESLHLHDNGFISVLLSHVYSMNRLRFCLIERCCELKRLVVGQGEYVDALESLESIQVFDLAKLKTICSGKLGRGSFQRLKHIHLHLCPNLVSCFSSITCLVQLESLEIEFCARMKVVFEEEGEKDQIVFPSLKRIWLCGLPKLQSICLGSLPKLEELKVKGCPKLEKIPLCINVNPDATPLKITAEKKWWANIKGGEEINQSRIKFIPWHSYFL